MSESKNTRCINRNLCEVNLKLYLVYQKQQYALLHISSAIFAFLTPQESATFGCLSASTLLPLFYCSPDECITLLKIQLACQSVVCNFSRAALD
jgi:hypothetical protein